MTERKTSGVRKQTKETGTWYKSLIEGKAKAEYYRHFIKKINDLTTKYFGEQEAQRILRGINSKKIQVTGIEAFLFDYNDISDPSLTLYNECSSIDEFLIKSIAMFKRRGEMGETNINIQNFFLVLSDMVSSNLTYNSETLERILYSFISSLLTTTDKSPYAFLIIEPSWASEIGGQLGLNLKKYCAVIETFFNVVDRISENTKNCKAFIPSVKIAYPVFEDYRGQQLAYLISKFRLIDSPESLQSSLKEIHDLGEDTIPLRNILKYWCERTGLSYNVDALIVELNRLGKSSFFKRYPLKKSLTRIFPNNKISKGFYKKYNVEAVFINKETFEHSLSPYFSEVQVNCKHLKKDNIEPFIDIAKTLNLIKGYYAKNKRDINTLTFKITLTNIQDISKDFIAFINEKLRKIKSETNKKFLIEVRYDNDIVTQRIPEQMTTHFRIISDIHTDYNKEHNYNFNFGDDFVLNCGDTAGDGITSAKWINTYMNQGATIIGNHLGYSPAYPDLNGIENVEKFGSTTHPNNTKGSQVMALFNNLSKNKIALLSNTCTEYQGVIIIGTCLYTDFNLYGEDHREECIAYAKKYMNDFRLPTILEKKIYTRNKNGTWEFTTHKKADRKVRPFTPLDHMFYFDNSFNFIKEKVQEHRYKPIVIMTHHAPSPYSISEEYKGNLLNAAFASNLNSFIVDNPQIRLWSHGHMHTPFDYILGETRIVCCPFGYNNENNFNLPYDYGLRISITDIKSKKSWRKILQKEIASGEILTYES